MSAASSPVLLFNWQPPRPRARAIVIFIAASLVFHVLCFYIFQIVYPQTVVLQPPPARVSVITNSSEEGRALLRWIEAEDPALASATQRPPEAKSRSLPRIDHIASYMNRQPPLKELPAEVVDLRTPSALPPGPVPTSRNTNTPQLKVAETTVVFSEELDPLGSAQFPQKKFAAATNEQPDSVRFRIAVNAHGEIHYAFRVNSSGDAALDQQAREFITLIRFPERAPSAELTAPKSASAMDSIVWGIATVNWGNDIARAGASGAPIP